MHAEPDIVLTNSVRLSVCLSVCLSVQCQYCAGTNGSIVTFFHILVGIILVVSSPTTVTKFQGDPLSGELYIRGWENIANIALYLVNGTTYARSHYGILTGSHRWPITLCQFQLPSVTAKGGMWKVKLLRWISVIMHQPFLRTKRLTLNDQICHSNTCGGWACF